VIAEDIEEFKEVITDKFLNFTIMANYSMEEIIRLNIQAYGVDKWESDDENDYIYTNLDGTLRDIEGRPIPKRIENGIRYWHNEALKNGSETFYVIFYRKHPVEWDNGREGTGYIHFTACLTGKTISFRVVIERDEQEIERRAFYSFRWTELVETKENTLYKNDSHNMGGDPIFLLCDSCDGISIYTKNNKYLNIPVVYFARQWVSDFLNSIIRKEVAQFGWGSLRTPKPAFELLYRSTEENRKREAFIRNLIEIQGMNQMGDFFEDNPNQQNIYTNIDGILRDGFGVPMPIELEQKVRKWHYLSQDYPIYTIYYQCNEGKTNNGSSYKDSFSTCITSNFISFCGIDEINGKETEYCSYYTLYWDDIVRVFMVNNINKEQDGLLEQDPTFTLTEEIGAYLFRCRKQRDVIIPIPYFANFYGDSFIDYIVNPEKIEKSRQLKLYKEEAEQYFAQKEYQGLLNTLERIQKEDLLSLYVMSDYYFLRISAFVGLNQRENAFREFERFQEYMENAGESEQESCLGAFLKARSLIYTLDKQYYLAAQDNEQVVAIEKEKERPEIVERYRDKQKENYQNFLTHFTEIPVKDRNIITIAKTDRLFKSDHLTLLNYDNLPKVHFPMSHPKINHSYIVHPYKTDSYLPIENYDYELLNDRLNEFFYFLQCLGATSISYEVVEDESSQQAARTQQTNSQNNRNSNYNERSNNSQHGGSVGGSYGFVSAEIGGSSSAAHSGSDYGEGGSRQEQSLEEVMNSSLRNFLKMGRNQTFDPLQKPYIPDDLIWFPNEYTWQRIAQQRLSGNMLSHSETLSSSESQTLSVSEIATINEELDDLFEEVSNNSSHFDISGKLGVGKFNFKASYNEDKSNTAGHSGASSQKKNSSYRSESKIKRNRDYAVRIHVTFKPMNAFTQDISYTEVVPEPKTTSHVVSQSILSDDEERYLEEVHFMLQDDGMIDDKERDILERYRTRFGISQTRAKELEDQAMASSILTPEEQEYVNEYKAALSDGILGERDRRILNRLAGFLKLSDERIKELEEKYKG
jgi:hypothetical protein